MFLLFHVLYSISSVFIFAKFAHTTEQRIVIFTLLVAIYFLVTIIFLIINGYKEEKIMEAKYDCYDKMKRKGINKEFIITNGKFIKSVRNPNWECD